MEIRTLHPGDPDDRALMEQFYDQMGFEARAFFNHGDGNRRFTLSYLDGTCSEKSVHWIAVEDGRVAGYVFMDRADSGIPWLGIAVAEFAKGKHLGRELIAVCQNWCRANGRGGIILTTHQANVRAQMLYGSCGFKRLGNHSSGEVLYCWSDSRPWPAEQAAAR